MARQRFLSNAMARCLTIDNFYTIIARKITSISRPKGNISSKDMIDNWHTKGHTISFVPRPKCNICAIYMIIDWNSTGHTNIFHQRYYPSISRPKCIISSIATIDNWHTLEHIGSFIKDHCRNHNFYTQRQY